MQEEERRLAGEIDALLRSADETDVAEDVRLGPEVRGDELPAELQRREDRLAAIRAAKARLEAAQRAADDARGRQPGQTRNPKGGRPYKRAYGEPEEKAQSNFTDPESGIMKTSNEGFQQCYNAQAAVDAEHQLVVATDVTANASDQGGLPVLLDAVQERFDAQPETVLADAGYCNERDLTELETRGVDGYVATGREDKKVAARNLKKHPATGRMVEKLSTPAGRAVYAERKWLSEAPYGWIKHVLGCARVRVRRKEGVTNHLHPESCAGRRRREVMEGSTVSSTTEEASGDGSHGGEAVDAGGPGGVCGTEVVVGGAVRLDQARAGLPALQPAWTGEGAGRVGPGVPGGERQAPAPADGGVTGTDLAPLTENRSRIAAFGRCTACSSVPSAGWSRITCSSAGGLRPDAVRHDADRRGSANSCGADS